MIGLLVGLVLALVLMASASDWYDWQLKLLFTAVITGFVGYLLAAGIALIKLLRE